MELQMTLENLTKALEGIGWSIKGQYPNSWVFDKNGKRANVYVKSNGLEVQYVFEGRFDGTVYFGFSGSQLTVEDGMVSVGTKECFISFYNHDKGGVQLERSVVVKD